MSDPANRAAFIQFTQDLRNDPDATLVPADQKWFDKGLLLFAGRLDKKWSLTDCISFVVMQELGLSAALTGDGDFVQAGFRKLMT